MLKHFNRVSGGDISRPKLSPEEEKARADVVDARIVWTGLVQLVNGERSQFTLRGRKFQEQVEAEGLEGYYGVRINARNLVRGIDWARINYPPEDQTPEVGKIIDQAAKPILVKGPMFDRIESVVQI